MREEHVFDVYGRTIAIVGEAGSWRPFFLGNEGKRRPADFVVPRELSEAQLGDYLADLFHEWARPAHISVRRLK